MLISTGLLKNLQEKQQLVNSVTHVPQPERKKQVLLMMCRAKVSGPDGSVIRTSVFLDLGTACSFVTERLAQQLRLAPTT